MEEEKNEQNKNLTEQNKQTDPIPASCPLVEQGGFFFRRLITTLYLAILFLSLF